MEVPLSKYYRQAKEIDLFTLDIFEAYMPDEGVYKVTAVNASGRAESTCKLTVVPRKTVPEKERPTFVKKPSNVYFVNGDMFKIEALVQGTQPIEVTWLVIVLFLLICFY